MDVRTGQYHYIARSRQMFLKLIWRSPSLVNPFVISNLWLVFIRTMYTSIRFLLKNNTSGKQKRGGDFAEPKKNLAIKKRGKEKSGSDFEICFIFY